MQIDYYYSVLSDWAYFGGERLERLALRHGATIRYKPMRLSQVYEKTGGILLQKRSMQRQDYRVVELERWSKYLGIPIVLFPKHYPTDDKLASCMIIAAANSGWQPGRLSNALLRAIWADDRDIADRDTLLDIAHGLGLNGKDLLRQAELPETASQWQANTEEGVAAGVFGSPFYLCDGHLFWGQDRLPFLEDVLQSRLGTGARTTRPVECNAA
jgi:2-hydroxychromene-2-carboxylate isomerase